MSTTADTGSSFLLIQNLESFLSYCQLVLVRYSIYRSIAILVNVRYRYLVVSRYFDISNIEWINEQSDDTWAIYKYRVSNEISSIQVAPEYVDEITFTTKVSSIECRVSNQIQVSINIVGIRYRTSTIVNTVYRPFVVSFIHSCKKLKSYIFKHLFSL